jgi:UDP-glucose 4-epimerase
MAKCLVLGANGFIGSHLVDSLISSGHSVRAFDRFSGGQLIKYKPNENIEEFSGDFLNRDDIVTALKDIEYVFHFISTTTPATAENDPLIDVDTNIRMSIILFEECVNSKIKKVIFSSTGGAIYGDTTGEPIAESVLPQPISPYAIGKLTIEHYLRYFHRKFDLNSLVFRISNPYGDRQPLHNKQGVIPIFLQHIANDEPITVLGDGSMVRDYIYVEDVANMIVASFETSKEHLYNIGSGYGVTVNELVEAMKPIVGRPINIESKEIPATFINCVVLDVSKFQNEFHITPQLKLTEGIQKTWDYVLANQKA